MEQPDNTEVTDNSSEPVNVPENLETNDATTNTDAETSEAPVSFLDSVSEDLRNEPSLKDFKDINGLVKSYINANKMIGKSDIPNKKSTPEEWDKFYTKTGRPTEAGKYELPEGQEETSLLTQFREVAFEKGMNNGQFQDIINLYNNFEQQSVTEVEAQNQAFQEQFKEEFGEDAENVKQNAINLIGKYANDEDREVLNSLDGTTTISLARIFNKMANINLREGSLETGNSTTKSLAEVGERMAEIKRTDIFYGDNKEYQELSLQKRRLYTQGASA